MKQVYEINSNKILAIDPDAIGADYETKKSCEEKENESFDKIVLIDICGPLEHKMSFFWDSYDSIEERILEALKSADVKAIILKLDSPGGEASGSIECHRTIKSMRKKYNKPIYAYVDEMACSAAYAIASACDEIWLPETGTVGSIGVIATLVDRTSANEAAGIKIKLVTTGKHKADGHPDNPITDEIINVMQERVDYLGSIFFDTVSEARGIKSEDIEGLEAGVFQGKNAVDKKLADNVDSFENFYQYININIDSINIDLKDSPKKEANKLKDNAKMETKLSLIKSQVEAKKALALSTSEDEKKELVAKIETLTSELSKYQDSEKAEDKEPKEAVQEDDTEEKSEEDEEDEEEKSEDDSEEEDDDEEDEEDEKALFNSKSGNYSSIKLLEACKKLTGQKDLKSVFGALAAIEENKKNEEKSAARLAKLEVEVNKSKVEALVKQAKKEGRIAPSQTKAMIAMGMKDGVKVLKGFLSNCPKIVRTAEDSEFTGVSSNMLNNVLSTLDSNQLKVVKASAAASGRNPEEVAKELLAKIASKESNKI